MKVYPAIVLVCGLMLMSGCGRSSGSLQLWGHPALVDAGGETHEVNRSWSYGGNTTSNFWGFAVLDQMRFQLDATVPPSFPWLLDTTVTVPPERIAAGEVLIPGEGGVSAGWCVTGPSGCMLGQSAFGGTFEIVEVEDDCDSMGRPVHIDFDFDFGDESVGGRASGSGVAFLFDLGC